MITVERYGDAATLVRCAPGEVFPISRTLEGIGEVVPGLGSVAVLHEVGDASYAQVRARLDASLPAYGANAPGAVVSTRRIEIPVCYDGPDLENIASTTNMSVAEVVRRLATTTYEVAMIGFAPGFPYLRGLDPALRVPRLATPRVSVPAGSVAIAEDLLGIYPSTGPGGWNLVGRTDVVLFDPDDVEGSPSLLEPGDHVRFVEVQRLGTSLDLLAKQRRADPRSSTGAVEVIEAGLLTVQDFGRRGFARYGVPRCGAADMTAMRLANLLVGNPADAAVLEATMLGPVLRFHQSVDIAVAGAETALPHGQTVSVERGSLVQFGPLRGGARSYIAVRGGVACMPVLGSRSTDVRNSIGPRPLKAGDRFDVGDAAVDEAGARWVTPDKPKRAERVIRVLPGPHDDARLLTRHVFDVHASSDRIGVRLTGTRVEDLGRAVSLPMVAGGVQIPPDGRPIVLLVDHGTTGGYPVAGVVISADLPVLAQLAPGDRLQFAVISFEQAVQAWTAHEQWWRTAVARLDLL